MARLWIDGGTRLRQDAASEPSGVWVARLDGSDPVVIAPGAFYPDWSSDGQHIAFAANSDEGMGLFASAADGTARTPILSDPAGLAACPALVAGRVANSLQRKARVPDPMRS